VVSRRTASEAETEALGRELAAELAPDGILLLWGDLGAGKTVLVKGLAEGLGISRDAVQSPTFTLVREYRAGGVGDAGGVRDQALLHLDLYRLEPEEAEALGLEEIFTAEAVKVVEWAERLPWIPDGARIVQLRRVPGGGPAERDIEEIKEES
jgi:tRNA threonylcarbamoyladenosine biosynthesis protein TsaE